MKPTWKESVTVIIASKKVICDNFTKSPVYDEDFDFLTISLDKIFDEISLGDLDEKERKFVIESVKNTDYYILMTKQNNLNNNSKTYVFPHGKFKSYDFMPIWWKIFNKCNVSRDDLITYAQKITTSRPTLIRESLTYEKCLNKNGPNDYLPINIALRITAIKEIFVKTGILLLRTTKSNNENLSSKDKLSLDLKLIEWREKVSQSPKEFINLCLELKSCPDIWLLYEWSNWLSPISVGYKRFDSMFYVLFLDKTPEIVFSNTLQTLRWVTPFEILKEHADSKVLLDPSHVYELSRINQHKKYESFKIYTEKRELEGVERWLPVLTSYNDGTLSALPGDFLYPKKPDFIGVKPMTDLSVDLKETYKPGCKLNRILIKKNLCIPYCNHKSINGHLPPLTYISKNKNNSIMNYKL